MSSAAGLDLGRFTEWWLGELRACLPRPLEALLFPAPAELIVEIGAAEARLSLSGAGQTREIGRLSLAGASDEAIAKEAEALLRKGGFTRGRVTLRLPAGQVLRPSLELPVAAAENLREVLALEMDRHTPFAADEVYFDFRVAGSDADLQRLSVRVAAARKTDVERAAALARKMGLTADRVAGPGRDALEEDSENLLPEAQRTRSGKFARRLVGGAAALTAALAVAAAAIATERDREKLEALETRLAALRASAGEVGDLEARAEALRAVAGHLDAKKFSQPQMVAILDEVTRRLPDEHWLVSYTYHDGRIQLAGYSDDPSSLLRLLEQSDMFSGVEFAAPVTMDPRIGQERFNLIAAVGRDGGGK